MSDELDKELRELGEDWVLERILGSLSSPQSTRLKIGDDAVELCVGEKIVVSGDMLVESTDVPPGMSRRQIGLKSVTSVISDLAAKGAEPLYFIVELGLPAKLRGREFIELWNGILEAAERYGGTVVGGDTNEAGEIVIGVTGIGMAHNPVPRAGARPGEILAVTGPFGKTYAGLHAAIRGLNDPRWRPLLEAVYEPKARLKEGIALANAGIPTAAIDSSDGLEACLHELSLMSGVGFIVERLPLDPLAEEYLRDQGLDLIEAVFRGGEEYELVLTLPASKLEEALTRLSHLGSTLTPIGRVVAEMGVKVETRGGVIKLGGKGWRHFRR